MGLAFIDDGISKSIVADSSKNCYRHPVAPRFDPETDEERWLRTKIGNPPTFMAQVT
jgi:hypothetical protein